MSRKQSNTELDRLRLGRNEVENHYIDELVSGRLDRRTFLRRGSMIGMSVPLMGAVLAACGSSSSSSSASSAASSSSSAGTPKKGGTLRIAVSTPAAAVNPLTVSDAGGLCMLGQTGEFLIFDSNLKLALQPMLATEWTPNYDGSVWTFTLRTGVTFNNGAAMTADDVVYTFQQLADPKNASNALSVFTGVLSPVRRQGDRPDDGGVPRSRRRTATSPTSSRPTTTTRSSCRRAPTISEWQSTFLGTGAFKLSSYTESVGASTSSPTPSYWGGKPYLDGTPVQVLLAARQPQILALAGQRGRRDRPVRAVRRHLAAEQLLLQDHQAARSSNHRELSMRNDVGAVHRRARAPGGRLHTRPPGDGERAARRFRHGRQRLPVRRRGSPRPTRSIPAAHAEPRQGQAAAVGGRAPERLQHHAEDRDLRGDPAACAGDQAERQRRSGSTSA